MRVEAALRIEGLGEGEASAIARALAPDNKGLPRGSRILLREKPKSLEILLEGDMELGSFEWTLRDLLLCLRVSQGVLRGSGWDYGGASSEKL